MGGRRGTQARPVTEGFLGHGKETMKQAVWALVGICLGLFMPAAGGAQSALENPPDGGKLSGISIISGWKCTAGTLTFTIDNDTAHPGSLVYGSSRGDTQ